MKITSLVENSSQCGLKTAHGLSLYIETEHHKILFDLGVDYTFIDNAMTLGIDISEVDIVVISHGHRDHGGGLSNFLELNKTAKIYIQTRAFLPHFSHRSSGVANIGLDISLRDHEQIELIDGDYIIDSELRLFNVTNGHELLSGANSSLYEGDKCDKFEHEQNLIITESEGSSALIMGCGHCGVVNILSRVGDLKLDICVGGFHLTNPSAKRDEPRELLDKIIERLESYSDVEFYTCHCTGETVYAYLKSKMGNINYFSCGMTIGKL